MSLSIAWVGLAKYHKTYKRNKLRKFRKEQKSAMRTAAKIVLKQARHNIRGMFTTHGEAKSRGNLGVLKKTLSQATKVSVRSRRGAITAKVGTPGKQGAYGKVLEEGRLVTRKSRSGNQHTAQYPKVPWLSRSVKQTAAQVHKLIGRSFRVF